MFLKGVALATNHALVDGPAYISGWATQTGLDWILKKDIKLGRGRELGSESERIRGKSQHESDQNVV